MEPGTAFIIITYFPTVGYKRQLRFRRYWEKVEMQNTKSN